MGVFEKEKGLSFLNDLTLIVVTVWDSTAILGEWASSIWQHEMAVVQLPAKPVSLVLFLI